MISRKKLLAFVGSTKQEIWWMHQDDDERAKRGRVSSDESIRTGRDVSRGIQNVAAASKRRRGGNDERLAQSWRTLF